MMSPFRVHFVNFGQYSLNLQVRTPGLNHTYTHIHSTTWPTRASAPPAVRRPSSMPCQPDDPQRLSPEDFTTTRCFRACVGHRRRATSRPRAWTSICTCSSWHSWRSPE
jgi:hypothetical protein